MHTNVNLAAPIGVLLFLGTGLLLVVLILVFIFGAARRNPKVIVPTVMGISFVLGAYVFAMLIFSVGSTERVLARDIDSPVLTFCESDWMTHLIIGHENSLAHRKTLLQL